jgi:zinc transport system substrate-binding protein
MKQILTPLVLISLLISCQPKGGSGEKPVLSVSILPQQYFVEQLAGELVEVNVLIPPGASPATYEPTISQLGKLEQSELYLRIGHIGFELSWMDKITSVNPEMKIVDLSRGAELIYEEEGHENHHGHSHGGTDPHLWLSVDNARIISQNLHQALLLMFPDHEEELKLRLTNFNASLDSLQQNIRDRLDGLEERSFIIYHPALTYFSREYHLHQYSLEIEGKSPSPAHLREITDLALENNISLILIQDQFDRTNAEVLAKEIGAEILAFDPLDPNWMEQMLYIADLFNSSKP